MDGERELRLLRGQVEIARERVARFGEDRLPELVDRLDRLGAALIGDRAASTELHAVLAAGVDAARRLVRTRPDQLPALAAALYRQSLALGIDGRRTEAQPPAREAVDHYRTLAAENRADFAGPYATALENLANQLSGPATRPEAIDAVRAALVLRRALLAERPEPRQSLALASALADLGLLLGEAGRHAEAVDAAREAVRHYAAHGGGQGTDQVAYWAALLSLVEQLEHTGARHEADVRLAEIAAAHRRVTDDNPALAAHLDGLLRTHGYRIAPDGRPQPTAPGEDGDGLGDVARIGELTRRGHALAERGELPGAVAAFQLAVELARRLPPTPARHRLVLAAALNDLGLALGWADRPGEAAQVLAEAVGLNRRLLPEYDTQVRPLLAGSLDALGTRFAAAGRHPDALAVTREAVELLQPAADRPEADAVQRDAAGLELARILNNLSIRQADRGYHEEARDASRQAVARYRAIRARDEEYLSGLVHALANLALREARLEHTEPVPALVREVAELVDRPVRFPPGSGRAALAESLDWLAWYLRGHRERGAARLAKRAAADLRKR